MCLTTGPQLGPTKTGGQFGSYFLRRWEREWKTWRQRNRRSGWRSQVAAEKARHQQILIYPSDRQHTDGRYSPVCGQISTGDTDTEVLKLTRSNVVKTTKTWTLVWTFSCENLTFCQIDFPIDFPMWFHTLSMQTSEIFWSNYTFSSFYMWK